jgi:hypothetical protein
MKKKVLLGLAPLLLGLLLSAGAAVAGDPVASVPLAPQSAVAAPACLTQQAPALAVAGEAQAPAALDLFLPEALQAAPSPCPLIGCLDDNGYCRRDSDCNAAPGGVCNLFCPRQGCCGYPG